MTNNKESGRKSFTENSTDFTGNSYWGYIASKPLKILFIGGPKNGEMMVIEVISNELYVAELGRRKLSPFHADDDLTFPYLIDESNKSRVNENYHTHVYRMSRVTPSIFIYAGYRSKHMESSSPRSVVNRPLQTLPEEASVIRHRKFLQNARQLTVFCLRPFRL